MKLEKSKLEISLELSSDGKVEAMIEIDGSAITILKLLTMGLTEMYRKNKDNDIGVGMKGMFSSTDPYGNPNSFIDSICTETDKEQEELVNSASENLSQGIINKMDKRFTELSTEMAKELDFEIPDGVQISTEMFAQMVRKKLEDGEITDDDLNLAMMAMFKNRGMPDDLVEEIFEGRGYES